jgi:putative tryptophan/tyrosine transport system substrate-binding protein
MRRRDFVSGLGGAAIWSLSARAQQSRSVRKIGVLVNFLSGESEGQVRTRAFTAALQKFGWIEGENLHTEFRYAGNDENQFQRFARELVEISPDVIVAGASPSVAALQRITHSVPMVFAGVATHSQEQE